MRNHTTRAWRYPLVMTALLTLVAACGSTATAGVGVATSTPAASGSSPAASGGSVTLVTHDSFGVDKKVLAAFEASSGIKVTLLAQGDVGVMVNKLILTKSDPLGDAVFGIDNTFASRALDAGILQPYSSPLAANGSEKFAVGDARLTPVDYGDVCVNIDHRYFAKAKLAEPTTFEDLAKPAYKNLLVVESPATSSPGLAFLVGTVAHFGDSGWPAYWTSLKNNGVKVDSGWTDAYTVDFSGSTGKGARPLVVSYASSPPSEVANGVAPTSALLDTCFRQVEYAGVLNGARNPAAAQKVVDFLLSKQFQAGVADQMYVYPVDAATPLPSDWRKFAPIAAHPESIAPGTISAKRDGWISAWSDLVEG
ncbi:thiamine ABC transporter substrate binding subunit [Nakamurella sp. PAMC28650]|uniref:thiamine ABC transporter substrate-binding protein n=1 Tax=Nakamurella sp. PAMC28650 TaxID=2762325 RepID=UPI001C9B8EEA|nr:thiamine ABC transporter substrate-binding protein [Nakamurella sp. PAMC28650]